MIRTLAESDEEFVWYLEPGWNGTPSEEWATLTDRERACVAAFVRLMADRLDAILLEHRKEWPDAPQEEFRNDWAKIHTEYWHRYNDVERV